MLQKFIAFVIGLFKRKELDVWDKARATHAALLKDWNKQRAVEMVLQEQFITADGAVFYAHKNISDVGVIRERKMRELVLKTAFGITPARVAKFEKDLSAAIENKRTDDVLKIAARMASDMKAAPELLALCELGALLLFRHDERPDTFNAAIHADKVRLMQLDDTAQFFFAIVGWEVTRQTLTALQQEDKLDAWKLTSEDDFHVYFQNQVERLKKQPKPTI